MRGGLKNYPVVIDEFSSLPKELKSKLKGCATSGNVEDRVYGFTSEFVDTIYKQIIPQGYQIDKTPDKKRDAIIKDVVAKTAQVTQLDMDKEDIPEYLFKTNEQHLADARRGESDLIETLGREEYERLSANKP